MARDKRAILELLKDDEVEIKQMEDEGAKSEARKLSTVDAKLSLAKKRLGGWAHCLLIHEGDRQKEPQL